jgi:hypothetical protein
VAGGGGLGQNVNTCELPTTRGACKMNFCVGSIPANKAIHQSRHLKVLIGGHYILQPGDGQR